MRGKDRPALARPANSFGANDDVAADLIQLFLQADALVRVEHDGTHEVCVDSTILLARAGHGDQYRDVARVFELQGTCLLVAEHAFVVDLVAVRIHHRELYIRILERLQVVLGLGRLAQRNPGADGSLAPGQAAGGEAGIFKLVDDFFDLMDKHGPLF